MLHASCYAVTPDASGCSWSWRGWTCEWPTSSCVTSSAFVRSGRNSLPLSCPRRSPWVRWNFEITHSKEQEGDSLRESPCIAYREW